MDFDCEDERENLALAYAFSSCMLIVIWLLVSKLSGDTSAMRTNTYIVIIVIINDVSKIVPNKPSVLVPASPSPHNTHMNFPTNGLFTFLIMFLSVTHQCVSNKFMNLDCCSNFSLHT